LDPIDRANPYLRTTGGQVIEYKEEKDNIYTWKIRLKRITNYMKQVRVSNLDRAFIQIEFHEMDAKKIRKLKPVH
jgi:hypothetical protein